MFGWDRTCYAYLNQKKSLQFVNRIMRALPENCDDFLHLLAPTTVAAFRLLVLELAGLQREVPQIARLISKAKNLTARKFSRN